MKNKIIYILILIFSTVCLSGRPLFAAAADLIKQGNTLLNRKNYTEAEKKYKEAQVEKPEAPEIYLDLGTLYYLKKDYDKAIDNFKEAAVKGEKDIEKESLFRLGNSYFKKAENLLDADFQEALDNFKKAISFYQDLLKKDSNNINAKINIQRARLLLKSVLDKIKKKEQKEKEKQKLLDQFKQLLDEIIKIEENVIKLNEDLLKTSNASNIRKAIKDQSTAKDKTGELEGILNAIIVSLPKSNDPNDPVTKAYEQKKELINSAITDEGSAIKFLKDKKLDDSLKKEKSALSYLLKLKNPEPPNPAELLKQIIQNEKEVISSTEKSREISNKNDRMKHLDEVIKNQFSNRDLTKELKNIFLSQYNAIKKKADKKQMKEYENILNLTGSAELDMGIAAEHLKKKNINDALGSENESLKKLEELLKKFEEKKKQNKKKGGQNQQQQANRNKQQKKQGKKGDQKKKTPQEAAAELKKLQEKDKDKFKKFKYLGEGAGHKRGKEWW